MKKLYALCLLTLAAVVLDIALVHTGLVHAQQPTPTIRIDQIGISGSSFTVPMPGKQIVGFSCQGNTCFVATISN